MLAQDRLLFFDSPGVQFTDPPYEAKPVKRKPRPTVIHVSQHVIRANRKRGTSDGQEVARVVYRPRKPLGCGARVWIEVLAGHVTVRPCQKRRGKA